MPKFRAVVYVGFQGHCETLRETQQARTTIQLLGESGGKLFRLVANFVAVCHAAQRRAVVNHRCVPYNVYNVQRTTKRTPWA